MATGDFVAAVFHPNSPFTSILQDLKAQTDGKGLGAHDIVLKLRDAVEDFLLTGTSTAEKHLSLIFSAVGAFMVFMQSNWTGPALPESVVEFPVRPSLCPVSWSEQLKSNHSYFYTIHRTHS